MLAGLQPVVMHATGTGGGLEVGNRRQGQYVPQQGREFLLAAAGHEEIPERPKAATLVGVSNGISFAHDFLKQRTLRAIPECDAFAYAPIQTAKIVLDLTEVGE